MKISGFSFIKINPFNENFDCLVVLRLSISINTSIYFLVVNTWSYSFINNSFQISNRENTIKNTTTTNQINISVNVMIDDLKLIYSDSCYKVYYKMMLKFRSILINLN